MFNLLLFVCVIVWAISLLSYVFNLEKDNADKDKQIDLLINDMKQVYKEAWLAGYDYKVQEELKSIEG